MKTPANKSNGQGAAVGRAQAGRFFRYMADYVGFSTEDAEQIRATKAIVEARLPEIVGEFYAHLLRFPVTRSLFLTDDGDIDQAYLQLRMRHLSNFWLRAADGVYDDDFAYYLDYVGRAHTSRGADPDIYIPERYVIGQVGMIQHALSRAVSEGTRALGDAAELQAIEAWDKLMMVILEMLARAYGHERQPEDFGTPIPVDQAWVYGLARAAVTQAHAPEGSRAFRRITIGPVADIPPEMRKIVQVEGLSIGIFHHADGWFAVQNSCVHQGGPVATGPLEGDILSCPWHGFQYNLRTGACLTDVTAKLERYPITVEGGVIYLDVPVTEQVDSPPPVQAAATLADNEFPASSLAPGEITTVKVGAVEVAVYNVDGTFYATDNACTHAYAPLNEGTLDGPVITCPWHGSCFNVITGAVLQQPATDPLQTYSVQVEGDIGHVSGN